MTEATVALEITGRDPTVIVSVNGAPAPEALNARKVTAYTPGTVALPPICPVVVLRDNPTGRPEASKEVGELLAVIA